MLGALKRLFVNTFGIDPFSSLAAVCAKRDELSFQYQCGSYIDDAGQTIHFLRVTYVAGIIQKTVSSLHDANMLEHLTGLEPGTLHSLVTVDKGGPSTKLMLQVLSSTKRHSIRTAWLLALFQGGTDSYKNMKKVLSPS